MRAWLRIFTQSYTCMFSTPLLCVGMPLRVHATPWIFITQALYDDSDPAGLEEAAAKTGDDDWQPDDDDTDTAAVGRTRSGSSRRPQRPTARKVAQLTAALRGGVRSGSREAVAGGMEAAAAGGSDAEAATNPVLAAAAALRGWLVTQPGVTTGGAGTGAMWFGGLGCSAALLTVVCIWTQEAMVLAPDVRYASCS